MRAWLVLLRPPLALIQRPVLPPPRAAEGWRSEARARLRPGYAPAAEARRVRVLFSAETPLSLTSYQSVIRELGRRGHEVVIAIHEEREIGWRDRLLEEVAAPPTSRSRRRSSPARDRWLELGADLRSSVDLFQFLGPRFNETYRARAWKRAPRPAVALGPLAARAAARCHGGRSRPASQLAGARACRRTREIERYLLDRRPDVVLFTPYLGLRSIQPDFLRAAQALGLRTAVCVKSWDNLSSKSRDPPASPTDSSSGTRCSATRRQTLHGIAARAGRRHRRAVLRRVVRLAAAAAGGVLPRASGLDPGRPFVLYACCSPWTGQSEVDFVRRWVEALRAPAACSQTLGVLVRPHPKRPDDWDGVDLSTSPASSSSRATRHAPTDDESKADYFDSIHHAPAVVGLNTSAMIEAAIVGRPVLTVLDPEYERVQQGTLHFRYLLEVGGGLLYASRDARRARRPARARDRGRGRRRARAERVRRRVRPPARARRRRDADLRRRGRALRGRLRSRAAANAGAAARRSGRCSRRSPRAPLASRTPARRDWCPSSNSQGTSGGARNRDAASSVAPISNFDIGAPCVLAWRLRSLARNARPLLEGALAADAHPLPARVSGVRPDLRIDDPAARRARPRGGRELRRPGQARPRSDLLRRLRRGRRRGAVAACLAALRGRGRAAQSDVRLPALPRSALRRRALPAPPPRAEPGRDAAPADRGFPTGRASAGSGWRSRSASSGSSRPT